MHKSSSRAAVEDLVDDEFNLAADRLYGLDWRRQVLSPTLDATKAVSDVVLPGYAARGVGAGIDAGKGAAGLIPKKAPPPPPPAEKSYPVLVKVLLGLFGAAVLGGAGYALVTLGYAAVKGKK